MATRDTPFAPGTPCWVDLLSSDTAKSQAFYGDLFGWTFDAQRPRVRRLHHRPSDGHAVAGLMGRRRETQAPDGWNTYISTADIDATSPRPRRPVARSRCR